jgi:hypothetical protein
LKKENSEMKKISCPEWEPIKMGEFDEQYLYRHFMFLGETGSGKTVSGIMPLCRTAFSPDGPFKEFRSAGLVVDPKGELAGHLETLLGPEANDRLIKLRSSGTGPVLWQFENSPHLEELGHSGIVEKMMSFAESFQDQNEKHNDGFWINTARQTLTAFVGLDLTLWKNSNGLKEANIRDFWNTFGALLYLQSDDVGSKRHEPIAAFDGDDASLEAQDDSICDTPDTPEPLERRVKAALYNRQFNEELAMEVREYAKRDSNPLISYQRKNYIAHLDRAFELSLSGVHDEFGDYWNEFVRFLLSWQLGEVNLFRIQDAMAFTRLKAYPENTYGCISGELSSIVADLKTEEFCRRISLNPFESPEEMLSTRDVIEQGKIVVYEPGINNMVTRNIGKLLKSCFFKALAVPERLNNSSARPFFYICDEFHNFITQDPESGEQSFMDRCRAYRVCCGLATQSIASLLNELDGRSGEHAVSILLVNTATKLFFRNTDRFTAETLFGLIESPAREGKPHVILVRPPSTLLPGECYYILVNGKSGRGRVAPVVKAESDMTVLISELC